MAKASSEGGRRDRPAAPHHSQELGDDDARVGQHRLRADWRPADHVSHRAFLGKCGSRRAEQGIDHPAGHMVVAHFRVNIGAA